MSELSEEEIARAIRDRSAYAAVLALLQPALERARREERERCAKVAESCGNTWSGSRCVEQAVQEAAADEKAAEIAAAIRKG